MATLDTISGRLLQRFKEVPGVAIDDATVWTQDAIERHGYSKAEDVPDQEIYLVLMLGQAEGARQIAVRTAHYFEFQDAEVRVNKSEVADRYGRLAKQLMDDYQAEKMRSGAGAVRFRVGRRVDRP